MLEVDPSAPGSSPADAYGSDQPFTPQAAQTAKQKANKPESEERRIVLVI